MRVIRHLAVLFLVVASMKIHVWAEGLKQVGIVFDEQSRARIAGANVSASGGQAIRDAITDAKGTFILPLAEGVKSGETIRIRVQKSGYNTYDEQWPVSAEVPLQISLVPVKKAHESPGRVPPSAPIVALPAPPARRDNIREQGLTLSKEILDFLADRERNDPHPEQAPGSYGAYEGAANKAANRTPKYMQETLVLFGDKFEARIADIHDELSARGLHDVELDSLYRNPARDIFGDVDAAIKLMANSIRKLALLVPPEGLYRDISDAQLAQIAIEEANKMDEMTGEAIEKLKKSSSPDSIRFFFSTDFGDCCLNQVQYLRAELIKRLGPSAYDSREMILFNGPYGFTDMGKNPLNSIQDVISYSPYFRHLAIKLKRKATPLSGPEVLTYVETQVASEKPTNPYKMVVTIQTKTDSASGYVFVQFAGRWAFMGCDFPDAKALLSGRDVIENPELTKLMEWNPGMPTYALKIGKTPFLSSRPIHIVVEAPEQIHVVKALLFDE